MVGSKVRDRITEVEGIVIGRTEWITGCATVGIQAPRKPDGGVSDPFWCDEIRVEVLEPAAMGPGFGVAKAAAANQGGPQPRPHNPSLRGG